MSTFFDFQKTLPQKPVEAKPSQQKVSTFTIATKGYAFKPEIGKCYEVSFDPTQVNVENITNTTRIKVNGPFHSEWVNLDTNNRLERSFVVQAYREISCSDSNGCSGD